MRLTDQDFKTFKALEKKVKAKTATPEETAEFERLLSIKTDKQDIAWYDKYKELFNNSAKLAFNYIRGVSTELVNLNGSSVNLSQPNVMVTYYISNPGRNATMNDPLNIMSRKLWVALHNKYRGLNAYEQADIGIVQYCQYSVIEMISFAERIFGTVRRYKVTDRNFPATLAKAMMLDISAWNSGENLMNFKFNLDLQVERFSQLFVPKAIAYIDRHVALNSIIFDDAKDSGKASHYFYYPLNYWVWKPTVFNSGSSAQSLLITDAMSSSNGFTPDDIISIITVQIDQLLADQDVTKMTSDLVNLLGESNSLQVSPINPDYKAEPIYSDDWLEQFHNLEYIDIPTANSLTDLWNGADFENYGLGTAIDASIIDATFPLPSTVGVYLYQVDNVIKFNLYAQGGPGTFTYILTPGSTVYRPGVTRNPGAAQTYSRLPGNDSIVDSWHPSPDEGRVMELTRWKAREKYTVVPEGTSEHHFCEIDVLPDALAYSIYAFDHNSVNGVVTTHKFALNYSSDAPYINKFDWHPLEYTYSILNQAAGINGMPSGDLDNFAIISRENLNKLHIAALMSLFDNNSVLDLIKSK